MANKHIGSSFDDFLEEKGILAETNAANNKTHDLGKLYLITTPERFLRLRRERGVVTE